MQDYDFQTAVAELQRAMEEQEFLVDNFINDSFPSTIYTGVINSQKVGQFVQWKGNVGSGHMVCPGPRGVTSRILRSKDLPQFMFFKVKGHCNTEHGQMGYKIVRTVCT